MTKVAMKIEMGYISCPSSLHVLVSGLLLSRHQVYIDRISRKKLNSLGSCMTEYAMKDICFGRLGVVDSLHI